MHDLWPSNVQVSCSYNLNMKLRNALQHSKVGGGRYLIFVDEAESPKAETRSLGNVPRCALPMIQGCTTPTAIRVASITQLMRRDSARTIEPVFFGGDYAAVGPVALSLLYLGRLDI